MLDQIYKITNLGRFPYFGFINGHNYLDNSEIENIGKLVGEDDSKINDKFEKEFSNKVGRGSAISFAAGRMAFFSLMKVLNIGKNDEVIIQGHTCSVMPNAVLRLGAKPIFSDIDPNTFGSSALEIEKVITERTKIIVAQHSFGIPCNIEPIVQLAKKKGIFLLEDCALTLGSSIKGVQVGNFGDAALFSIDHTKPINAYLGGLLYTKNKDHYAKLKNEQLKSENLSLKRQKAIWNKFLYERINYNPNQYGKSFIYEPINNLIYSGADAVLSNDYGNSNNTSYPYPARLPSFLAKIGLCELKRWEMMKKKRKSLLKNFINISNNIGISNFIPSSYFDNDITIVPLRFVYTINRANSIKKKMCKFINTDWFWFKKPIIVCKNPADLGYVYKSCPISEGIGKEIINWPCVYTDSVLEQILLKYFEKVHA